MPSSRNREWILLADKAHAKIFTRNYVDGAMLQHMIMSHPAAQAKQSDLGAGRPGHGHRSANTNRYAYEDHADFPEKESAEFLHAVASEVNAAVLEDEMDNIILIALPKTMKILKAELNDTAKNRISAEYAKNLIGVDESTLNKRLETLKS